MTVILYFLLYNLCMLKCLTYMTCPPSPSLFAASHPNSIATALIHRPEPTSITTHPVVSRCDCDLGHYCLAVNDFTTSLNSTSQPDKSTISICQFNSHPQTHTHAFFFTTNIHHHIFFTCLIISYKFLN
ncbi:hypothetical protein QVD17_07129 [Tagetes erecta]|uniref:Uncharacterized protein n=1 Tax=Tagetes erecta TaxID=13708 RepID=A0AAD8LH92_TARER|nr:hypothetical protein QVD17_07129 [Tagetes erecta]